MIDKSPNVISENTEITDRSAMDGIAPFFSATAWGALIGAIALTAGFALGGPEGPDAELLIGILFAFGVIVSVFTLAGMILVGLPITLMLRAIWWEPAWLYAALGAIAGFLIMAIQLGLPSEVRLEFVTLAVSGTLAGFASGLSWGLWREERAATRWQEPRRNASRKRDNPIHDLIH